MSNHQRRESLRHTESTATESVACPCTWPQTLACAQRQTWSNKSPRKETGLPAGPAFLPGWPCCVGKCTHNTNPIHLNASHANLEFHFLRRPKGESESKEGGQTYFLERDKFPEVARLPVEETGCPCSGKSRFYEPRSSTGGVLEESL